MDERVVGKLLAADKRVAIVASRWNELITKQLVEGARSALAQMGDPQVTEIETPGSWEIPIVVRSLCQSGSFDGVLALGCILQGATSHAQMLASDVSGALMRLQLECGVPISWGILVANTQEEALERAGMKMGNKGREAALALVETMSVLERIQR